MTDVVTLVHVPNIHNGQTIWIFFVIFVLLPFLPPPSTNDKKCVFLQIFLAQSRTAANSSPVCFKGEVWPNL